MTGPMSTEAVLAAIDDTLAGYAGAVSSEGGMMRWSPVRVICDGGNLLALERKPVMTISSIVRVEFPATELVRQMTAMCEALGRTMTDALPAVRRFGEALSAAFGPVAELACSRAPRSHRRRCRECNPHGNPLPLAIDGREYRRRQRNRVRRWR